jgi:hypothetical protein
VMEGRRRRGSPSPAAHASRSRTRRSPGLGDACLSYRIYPLARALRTERLARIRPVGAEPPTPSAASRHRPSSRICPSPGPCFSRRAEGRPSRRSSRSRRLCRCRYQLGFPPPSEDAT